MSALEYGAGAILWADEVSCWPRETMGRTLFGTVKGTLILTDERLLFVGDGKTDLGERAVVAGLGGIPGVAGIVVSIGDSVRNLVRERRRRKSSSPRLKGGTYRLVDVSLGDVTRCEHVRSRWRSFLAVQHAVEDARTFEGLAFGRQVGFPEGAQFETAVRALKSSPSRVVQSG